MTENQNRKRITVTIQPELLATLNSFAKDSGRNRSNALETIISEWLDLKTNRAAIDDLENRHLELVTAANEALAAIDPIAEFDIRARLHTAISRSVRQPDVPHIQMPLSAISTSP